MGLDLLFQHILRNILNKMENKTYDIYYDEEGDFLEVTFGELALNQGTEHLDNEVLITRNLDNNEVYSIGIIGFRKRCYILNEILKKMNINFPLNIGC